MGVRGAAGLLGELLLWRHRLRSASSLADPHRPLVRELISAVGDRSESRRERGISAVPERMARRCSLGVWPLPNSCVPPHVKPIVVPVKGTVKTSRRGSQQVGR